MKFRSIIFWLHLAAGVIAGSVIAIMSFTGVMLTFEKEIIAWSERDLRRVAPESSATQRQSLDELLFQARTVVTNQQATAITVSSDTNTAVLVSFGRTHLAFVNPYSGAVQESSGGGTRRFMETMRAWHRYLGRSGDGRSVGKAITGACNAAFLILAVSGLYLWWPRHWSRKMFRSIATMRFNLHGKARDWNWHNAVGFWAAPILIVLTITALPISYRWANDLIYKVTASAPPAGPGPNSFNASAVTPSVPPGRARRLDFESLLVAATTEVPDWNEITIRLAGGVGRGEQRDVSEGRASQDPDSSSATRPGRRNRAPVAMTLKQRGAWPLFSSVNLTLNPFTGEVLRKETFSDYNLGRKVRSWTRFLHTGEALGNVGQTIAGLASLFSLLLVWTGFSLAWRRFLARKKNAVT
jgi:uncharacterized iron-regulated membrane protein